MTNDGRMGSGEGLVLRIDPQYSPHLPPQLRHPLSDDSSGTTAPVLFELGLN